MIANLFCHVAQTIRSPMDIGENGLQISMIQQSPKIFERGALLNEQLRASMAEAMRGNSRHPGNSAYSGEADH